jgi:hypothetical protein
MKKIHKKSRKRFVKSIWLIVAILACLIFVGWWVWHFSNVPSYQRTVNLPIKKLQNVSKVMMCSGLAYSSDNSTWLTIDKNGFDKPTVVADITEIWPNLAELNADIILDEHCPYDVSKVIATHAATMLNHKGILLSKTCVPFKKLGQEIYSLKQTGFSHVLVLDWEQPPNQLTLAQYNAATPGEIKIHDKASAAWIKWLKTSNPIQIRRYFEEYIQPHEKLPQSASEHSCGWPFSQREWYGIVAIK